MKTLLTLLFSIVAMLFITSCGSGQATPVTPVTKSDTVKFRGLNIKTHIPMAIYAKRHEDVYKVGDTVWVYTTSGNIQTNAAVWNTNTNDNITFSVFVIQSKYN